MTAGADRGGQLGLDQLLQRLAQQAAEKIPGVLIQQINDSSDGRGIILLGHRVTTPP
jgi:hypothetical protein